jgi:hypothetical protein
MRSMQRLHSILLLFFHASAAIAQSPSLCFPRGSFSPNPRWDRSAAKGMAQYLKLLGEPCLFPIRHNPNAEVYRFLWMRTFNPPVSIRLDIEPTGTGRVAVTTILGESGFASTLKGPTTVTRRQVGVEEVARFRELVAKTDFLAIPPVIQGDQQGTDGSEWRIEAITRGQYHTASRWSPTSSKGPSEQAIAELGSALAFEIGQFQVNPDEIY